MEEKIVFGALAIPYKELNGNLEFLLLKHKSGMWTFPGGGMDEGDATLEDCLIRELQEEIGLTLDKTVLVNTGLVNKFTYGPEKPTRNGMKGETHFWLLKLTGEEMLGSWDNIIDYGWFDSGKIVELLPFPDEKRIFSEATKNLFM